MPEERFRQRVQELATAVEERPPIQAEAALPEHGTRTIAWTLTLTITLLAAAFGGLAVFMAPRVKLLSTTERVTALVGDNECTRAMAKVVDAISAYRRDHGGPPPQLADLSPAYLPAPPVDPVTAQPFEYRVSGNSVSLACPQPNPAPARPPSARNPPARSSG